MYCFQKNTDGNEGQLSEWYSYFTDVVNRLDFLLVSSEIETYSLVQDIDPSVDCAPKEVTFRPEFPTELKLRCLPFGFGKRTFVHLWK